jgi:hypothetical protein
MSPFPRDTGAITLPEPGTFRTLSRSLVEMAAITGVVVRLARSLVLSQSPAPSLFALWAAYVLGGALVVGMAALHLSNFTVRRWLWRAPAFVLVEVAAEMLVSALLMTMGREPAGTGSAHLHDWPAIAASTLVFRAALVLPFILVLGATVQVVRVWMARRRLL